MRNILWCYYRYLLTFIALEKCKKRIQHALNYSGTRSVCPLKYKTTFFGSKIQDFFQTFSKTIAYFSRPKVTKLVVNRDLEKSGN